MNIPVDGVVVMASGVEADEAAMTGESDHLPKDTLERCELRKQEFENDPTNKGKERTPHDVISPVLLSGTTIQTGEGWFICIVVGEDTCEGQILASLEDKGPEQTPLQGKLDVIAVDIGKLGMYAAILIFHCLLLRNFIEGMLFRKYDLFGGEMKEDGTSCMFPVDAAAVPVVLSLQPTHPECSGMIVAIIKDYLHYCIIGIAIIVVAVPEGLPLAVMISLAYSVQRMLEDHNFVKRLTSCEIMGGANNICSDKTGTLTMNVMTLTNFWSAADFKVEKVQGEIRLDQYISPKVIDLVKQAISVNTSGTLADASATELAMLKFLDSSKVDFLAIREKYHVESCLRFQFDSGRKRMSTVLDLDTSEPTENNYPKRNHIKGASEIVVESCTHYLDKNGDKKPIDDMLLQEIKALIEKYARQSLRTIGFAYKDLKENEGGANHEDKIEGTKIAKIEETDNTLIMIVGIKDIIREEVPGAVINCNEAGIRVRMVTGDNLITATAIAKECGIIKEGEENEDNVCMQGPEFAKFVGSLVHKDTGEEIKIMGKEPLKEQIGNPENMKIIRNKLKVLARSRPNDKYIMVTGLKQCGDIVAVTGDGTNDAPALKKADVGFAMKTGTNVAHNAADIIIQDDNFASIVKACMWGRNVFDNIRRFLQFQLTVNVAALVVSFIGSVVMQESPLAAIQLLWVNLIMDSLASLALATELPKAELLQRPPYRKKEYIISQKMVKHILGQAVFQSIVLFVFVFAGHMFIPEWQNGAGEGPLNLSSTNGNLYYDLIANHPTEELRTWTGEFVMNGMAKGFQGEQIYKYYQDAGYPSRHLTVVFNLFVLMQIWNMLCARKINDEFNFLEGVFTNAMFVGVWIIILVGQFLITQFGGKAMKVHNNGLTVAQWIICLLVSLICILVNAILKCIPDRICLTFGDESEEDVRESKLDFETLRGIAGANRATAS